jgi:hypothetical protein
MDGFLRLFRLLLIHDKSARLHTQEVGNTHVSIAFQVHLCVLFLGDESYTSSLSALPLRVFGLASLFSGRPLEGISTLAGFRDSKCELPDHVYRNYSLHTIEFVTKPPREDATSTTPRAANYCAVTCPRSRALAANLIREVACEIGHSSKFRYC